MYSSSFIKRMVLPVIPGIILISGMATVSLAAKTWQGKKVTYKGNVFETKEEASFEKGETINPATGQQQTHISASFPIPVKMNGKKIYTITEIPGKPPKLGDLANNASTLTSQVLKDYLLTKMDKELQLLDDGIYYVHITNIVVDETGKIVYYNFQGITKGQEVSKDGNSPEVRLAPPIQSSFAQAIEKLIDMAPLHDPAVVEGREVPSLIDGIAFMNYFVVKKHKLVML